MADGITVYGIDFTSRPGKKKPITCLECRLVGNSLRLVKMNKWTKFGEFETFLATTSDSQPWIAAMDFPFGLPLQFVENNSWPISWPDYIDQKVKALFCRKDWRQLLEDYKECRRVGDKEHRRQTDRLGRRCQPPETVRSSGGVDVLPRCPAAEGLRGPDTRIAGRLPGEGGGGRVSGGRGTAVGGETQLQG